jgi:hypothetical protein
MLCPELLRGQTQAAAKKTVTGGVLEQDEDGPRQMRERVLLYLQRHADNGVIEPERRRVRVAAEYARYREEENRTGRGTLAVGGSQWISLGPTNGAGRMTALAFDPNSSSTVYAGAAGGGLWRSTDSGTTWTPLTDGLNDLSVGAVAVAPSSPATIYLGTGEGGYAIDFIPGIGLLKSNDGGSTWKLPASVIATTFYRISVHPTNPNELVVGTREGAFRSVDGGNSWTNVISRSSWGDVPDLVRDANDPKTLYATTWCASGSCEFVSSHVLKSTDGGATWTDHSTGLPSDTSTGVYERMSVAMSASSSSVLYAARGIRNTTTKVVTSHVYRSADGGTTWADLPAVSGNGSNGRYMADQSWYNNVIVVSPSDSSTVLVGGTTYLRSSDGGTTFSNTLSGIHVDCHDLRYQGSTLWIANDGGIWRSDDDGHSASSKTEGLVTRQYYALAVDPVNRNRVLAGAQDNGTGQRTDAGGTNWRDVIGADGFECAINPLSPEIAWGTIQDGSVRRTKFASAAVPAFENVTPPFAPDETTPFLSIVQFDPRSAGTLYTGSTRVWKSLDNGSVWAPLTTATTDGSVWSSSATVTSIGLSRTDPLLLLVGKGRDVFRSADGGKSWIAGAGLPSFGVNNLEVDSVNSAIAYAGLSRTTGPSVYKTVDGGLTWAASATGLPPFAAQVIRVDPTDPNVLYCGTDVGVYRSTDQGGSWSKFGTGLPNSSVADLQIFEDASILRVATHGRGVWELQVPPTGNTPPIAQITSPVGSVSVAPGGSLSFTGIVADPDPDDAATGAWYFPDTTELVPFAGSVTHAFLRTGVYPVALTARDSHGARDSAIVRVTVAEAADDCAAPIVIPPNGPFPYSVRVNNEAATTQTTDPSPSCSQTPALNSVWISFTPSVAGTYEFSTCGSPIDNVMAAYTGPDCGPYTPIPGACNDDAPAGSICDGSNASLIAAPLTAGETAHIQVTSFDGISVGTFPFNVRLADSDTTMPRIAAVSASQGPPGGTTVLISGANFTDGVTVTFDGIPASEISVLDPTAISAKAPAHAPGDVDVAVTTAAGTGTLGKGFTYTAYTASPCVASSTALCLNAGRFRAEVQWAVPTANQSGQAPAVPLTADTGYFWFFSANNIELVVKVVDGRGFNGKFWVFYGALSNVEYRLTVTDLQTGAVRIYENPNGQLSSVADTAAF